MKKFKQIILFVFVFQLCFCSISILVNETTKFITPNNTLVSTIDLNSLDLTKPYKNVYQIIDNNNQTIIIEEEFVPNQNRANATVGTWKYTYTGLTQHRYFYDVNKTVLVGI